MDEDFSLEPIAMMMLAAEKELRDCNEMTAQFGLTLSNKEISQLMERRTAALRDTGRVEFGAGVLKKLVYAFCDSPYLAQEDYVETMADLQDVFYWFKNESKDQISDDELIVLMKAVFDGRAQGSVDYLSGLTPEELYHYADQKWDPEDPGEAGDLF